MARSASSSWALSLASLSLLVTSVLVPAINSVGNISAQNGAAARISKASSSNMNKLDYETLAATKATKVATLR